MSVRETASAAAAHAREIARRASSPTPTAALEEASGTALKRAVDVSSVRRQIAELVETTEAAVTAATRASERLTHQMVTLAETTSQIEAPDRGSASIASAPTATISRAAPRLLIEALNSASIDITKAFSAEVTDSAWAAYLKGDRGVFTRRAVRLLDPGETREIRAALRRWIRRSASTSIATSTISSRCSATSSGYATARPWA